MLSRVSIRDHTGGTLAFYYYEGRKLGVRYADTSLSIVPVVRVAAEGDKTLLLTSLLRTFFNSQFGRG